MQISIPSSVTYTLISTPSQVLARILFILNFKQLTEDKIDGKNSEFSKDVWSNNNAYSVCTMHIVHLTILIEFPKFHLVGRSHRSLLHALKGICWIQSFSHHCLLFASYEGKMFSVIRGSTGTSSLTKDLLVLFVFLT